MELSEEEKKAIEELKHFKKDKDCRYWIGENGIKAIDTIRNLIEKLKKENEDLRVQAAIVYLDYQPYKLIASEILEKLNLKLGKLKQEMDKEYDMYGKSDEFLNLDEQYDYLYEIKKLIEGEE